MCIRDRLSGASGTTLEPLVPARSPPLEELSGIRERHNARAMSQTTVELVRRHYAQIQQYLRNPASDFDRRLAEFLDDLAEPRYGHAGVRQYVEMLFEAIED